MALQPISPSPFHQSTTPVTRVGLGGEGILRTFGMEEEALAVIGAAVDAGITYFDSARVYKDSERYYGRFWSKHPGIRERMFHTSKTARRSREGALADLDETLERLKTDYLDLWQIHDVREEADLERIAGKGGALEAFVEAKAQGRVRHIGVTGHHDPEILTRAVEEWPVDAVLMPVNPLEDILGGFLTQTLPAARKKGIATMGMKVLGGGHYLFPHKGITPERLIQFGLEMGLDLLIVGCRTPEEVKTLARTGETHTGLSQTEMRGILAPFMSLATSHAFYRGSRFQIPKGK